MKKAVIVGINRYAPFASNLHSCVKDAESIAELLDFHENGEGNLDEVKVYRNLKTRVEFRRAIEEAFRREDEMALFYFAGHGGVSSGGREYLVTPDGDCDEPGIAMEELIRIANQSKCKNKIIILDCCHSGAIGSYHLFNESISVINSGLTILAASRPDEPSFENRVEEHGVFTGLLINALKGGAADLSGKISPGSVYAYIDKALGPFDQRPVFKTNVMEFISLRSVEPPVPLHVLRQITELFPGDPEKPKNLDSSYEFTNSPRRKPIKIEKPYAKKDNVEAFKLLQKLQSIGLVIPLGEEHMYFAAMKGKSCKLTPLGRHYWNLAQEGKIK